MRKFEDLKKLKNKRYSPKEALSYYIVSYTETKGEKNLKNIMAELIDVLLEIQQTSKALDKVEIDILTEIKNYWSLNIDQVISYAYILFNNLTERNQKIDGQAILEEFVYLMRIYSPSNAEEFVSKLNTQDIKNSSNSF